MMHHPSQFGDVELPVHFLVPFHHLPQTREILNRVFIAPAGLSHQPLRLAPHRAAVEGRGPLSNRARPHHVVAEERKLISKALLQFRQLRVVLVLREIHLQANDGLPFRMQSQPRMVHAVLIQIGKDLVGVKGARRREQYLVQVRRKPNAGRILHGIHGAAFLVLECLHPAQ
jgi:hypothetical protein